MAHPPAGWFLSLQPAGVQTARAKRDDPMKSEAMTMQQARVEALKIVKPSNNPRLIDVYTAEILAKYILNGVPNEEPL